jgi:crotonobetainyl-CoA:carnitine CoA-transferase CaiB-like acyl-CoA transferase
MGPIDGVRILDLTVGICGPYATKLLADYGADVVKVEPPGGDLARKLAPFPGDVPDPEKSGTFLYFNTNKRSVVLDLARPPGLEAFGLLVDWADVVVESFKPGVVDRLGIGWEFISARKPGISLVSITNFGQESPYRDYEGTELTLYGFAGEMYTMGVAEREPVKMFGTAALVESGAAASNAVMASLFVSKRQGIGQHVDFAIADSQFGGADRRHVSAIASEFAGRKTPRSPMDSRGVLRGVYPCADGYVEFSGAGGRLDRFARMLGSPEWLADPKWQEPGALFKPENAEEFDANFYPWLMEHSKKEIWSLARDARVLAGPLFTIDELVTDDHFRARGFWQGVEHPAAGAYTMPGRPFIMNASPWELRRPAPLLGQHTREVLAEVGLSAAAIDGLTLEAVPA